MVQLFAICPKNNQFGVGADSVRYTVKFFFHAAVDEAAELGYRNYKGCNCSFSEQLQPHIFAYLSSLFWYLFQKNRGSKIAWVL